MKKNSIFTAGLSLLTLLVFSVVSHAQIFAEDFRPFDFRDKYYEANGILAHTLIGRKNGMDGMSVFDTTTDTRFSNVRILETQAGYDDQGAAIYWNYYGGASKESFTSDIDGGHAIELAYEYKMFVFPSATVKESDRQAAMIRATGSYFEKNPLGIAAVYVVEYTSDIFSQRGRRMLELLATRNGYSLDGTPIIRTYNDLSELSREGLVLIRPASSDNGDGRTGFAVARVLQETGRGAIADDAFLVYVKQRDGGPLAAEAHFVSKFECLKDGKECP